MTASTASTRAGEIASHWAPVGRTRKWLHPSRKVLDNFFIQVRVWRSRALSLTSLRVNPFPPSTQRQIER